MDYRNILYSPLFSKLVITFIILLVGLIIGRIIGGIIKGVLHEIGLNDIIRKTSKIKVSVEKVISNFVSYFIYFVTIIMALTHLGLTTTVLNIIIVAIITIVIITIFFIIRDIFPNIIAGIFIKQKNNIKEGDYIEIDSKTGKIVNINAIEITIKTKEGNIIYIPNSLLSKKEITKLKG